MIGPTALDSYTKGIASSLTKRVTRSLARRIFRRSAWNKTIDSSIQTLSMSDLPEVWQVELITVAKRDYFTWLASTQLPFRRYKYPHKKAVEFFFSCYLLAPSPWNHVLDAAGGRSGYLEAVRSTTGCANLYLTDHIYSGCDTGNGIHIVGGDIAAIDLPDQSVDRISCHHAFEHFQGDRDRSFIREIGRLLQPCGRACIIPIFVTNRYIECWNISHAEVFDTDAELIVDHTASIPGADDDGHFARFYNVEALERRVLETAKESNLIAKIVVCQFDGKDLPDMKKNFGSNLNFPLRALVLEKL